MSIAICKDVKNVTPKWANFNYNERMNREPVVTVTRIQQEIDRRGQKPGEVAAYSGVKYHTLYKVLNHNDPRTSAEVIAKLAAYFGCSIEYLMGMTDERAPLTIHIGELLEELIQVARPLPRSKQRDLLRIAQAFSAASQNNRRERWLEIRELLLEGFSELGLHAEADRLLGWLNDLERFDSGNRGDDPLLGGDGPDEPGEEDT